MAISAFSVRPLIAADREWVAWFITTRWGADQIVSRGVVHYASALPGFIAMQDKERVGLVTYRIERGECEIITLNSL
jgi:hypothetical protein